MLNTVKIVECPRDAMQAIKQHIPAVIKAGYINKLLACGFDTIDFGSFVSPKAIPQMADTGEVYARLDMSATATKLLGIVANVRGAHDLCGYENISYCGYPLSISETFQQRNTNSGIAKALETVKEIIEICDKGGKIAVIYLSMAFGNPYGDVYNTDMVLDYLHKLRQLGARVVSMADTVGVASTAQVHELVTDAYREFTNVEIGLHLHTAPGRATAMATTAIEAGCTRIDGALLGYGGCPFAKDELTGNLDTMAILDACGERAGEINRDALKEAINMAHYIFSAYQ